MTKTEHADFNFKAELYDKWRKKLFKTYLVIATIISVTEFVIFFFDDMAGLLFLPVPIYLLVYWIIPSVFNFSLLLITKSYIYSDKYSESTKNKVCVLQLFAVCSCSALIHYVFAPIMCAPCIAIFITVLFADKKLTKMVFVLSLVLIALITVEGCFGLRSGDPLLFLDTAVATVLAFSVYLSATLLTNFSKEQIDYISTSLERQKTLMNEMRIEPLTGLYNRLAMDEMLSRKLAEYEKNQDISACLAMIDIDFFKRVNDTYGHICGDEVIIEIAAIIRRHSDSSSAAFRYGGEEFAILLDGRDTNKATELLDEICAELAAHEFSFSPQEPITVSVGVAAYNGDGESSSWLERADTALYAAKNGGRNRLVVYGASEAVHNI